MRHLLVRRVWRGCYPMTPDGVRELERHGIDVLVETGAGAEDWMGRRVSPETYYFTCDRCAASLDPATAQ